MANKAKIQGTQYEVHVRDWFRGQGHVANRVAEGGSLDEGDVEVILFEERWLVECKARQALPVQATVAKALKKAGHGRAVLFWKRLVPSAGVRRTAVAGVPEVVCMTPDTLRVLLEDAYQCGVRSGSMEV